MRSPHSYSPLPQSNRSSNACLLGDPSNPPHMANQLGTNDPCLTPRIMKPSALQRPNDQLEPSPARTTATPLFYYRLLRNDDAPGGCSNPFLPNTSSSKALPQGRSLISCWTSKESRSGLGTKMALDRVRAKRVIVGMPSERGGNCFNGGSR